MTADLHQPEVDGFKREWTAASTSIFVLLHQNVFLRRDLHPIAAYMRKTGVTREHLSGETP